MKIITPFFMMNPKSYLYGKELEELALYADSLAQKYNYSVFFTAPAPELSKIVSITKNLIVTAQHMDCLKPGRGMGYILPESLLEIGVKATFLNHAEHPMKYNELVKSISRTKELGIISVVCADSLDEAKAIAILDPDIILCEPTELIGTGNTSDNSYVKKTTEAIKIVNKNTLVMQAAGISSAKDVYNVIKLGADGTGGTSGILKAENPKQMLSDMLEALDKAIKSKE